MPVNNEVYRVRPRKMTKFESKVPQYFLNHNNRLEESPIMKDWQEIIDSAEYTSLDEMYDRMLEINAQMYAKFDGGELVQTREGLESDLDTLMKFDSIREKYAMSDPTVGKYTHAQMLEHINNKLSTANADIESFKNTGNAPIHSGENKEVVNNEKIDKQA